MSAPAVFRERRHAWAVMTDNGRLVADFASRDKPVTTALFRTKAEAHFHFIRASIPEARVVKVAIKYEVLS